MAELKEIIVKRDGEKDLRFNGVALASVSNRWVAGQEQTRWTEITVYQTESGKYVIAWEFITLWQGEENSYRAKVCERVAEVTAELMGNNPEGQAFFSDMAKELIGELAKSNEEFREQLFEEV